jgi:hypothetical protein
MGTRFEEEAIEMKHCPSCEEFARILGATILESQDGLCAVTRTRNLNIEIAGRPTKSPLVLAALFSFEDMDARGRTLNLGETVILPEEINPFISALRQQGIEVTALHNHWLFDKPRTMYIHFFSIEPRLADALDSGSSARKGMEVQVLSTAPNPYKTSGPQVIPVDLFFVIQEWPGL